MPDKTARHMVHTSTPLMTVQSYVLSFMVHLMLIKDS